MTQDEYTLTSSDEAFALGEEGRVLLLGMAEAAYTRALRATLITLKEAISDCSWNDYDQNTSKSYIGGLTGSAYALFKAACAVPEAGSTPQAMALYRLDKYLTGERSLDELTYFEERQFRRATIVVLQRYREAEDGTLRDTLEHAYAATDPTLAPEYADTLMPSLTSS